MWKNFIMKEMRNDLEREGGSTNQELEKSVNFESINQKSARKHDIPSYGFSSSLVGGSVP